MLENTHFSVLSRLASVCMQTITGFLIYDWIEQPKKQEIIQEVLKLLEQKVLEPHSGMHLPLPSTQICTRHMFVARITSGFDSKLMHTLTEETIVRLCCASNFACYLLPQSVQWLAQPAQCQCTSFWKANTYGAAITWLPCYQVMLTHALRVCLVQGAPSSLRKSRRPSMNATRLAEVPRSSWRADRFRSST